MLGKTIAQYCPNDSAVAKEQRKIEKQLKDVEQSVWGKPEPKDSLDSIARLDKKAARTLAKRNRRATRSKAIKVKASRPSRSSSVSSGSSARVTVRRQRH